MSRLLVGIAVVVSAALLLAGCFGSAPTPDEIQQWLDDNVPTGSVGDQTDNSNPSFPGPGAPVPDIGEPVSVRVVSHSRTGALVEIRLFVLDVEVRFAELQIDPFETTAAVGPDLATRIEVTGTYSDGSPTPSETLRLENGDFAAGDLVDYVLPDPNDECPNDPDKFEPGACGCGQPETDTDEDATPDCIDECPDDPLKIEVGACGCGAPETDTDLDGTPDCNDECPDDPAKTVPGVCGCGESDEDTDGDGTADCVDDCPADPQKTQPGDCGCGVADTDANHNGVSDCIEPPTEACCIGIYGDGAPYSTCEDLTYDDCVEAGGEPQGEGTSCQEVVCEPPPAARVFWSTTTNKIESELSNRSEHVTHYTNTAANDVAYGWGDGRIYWFDRATKHIRAGEYNGSYVETFGLAITGEIGGIEISPMDGSLFYTEFTADNQVHVVRWDPNGALDPATIYANSIGVSAVGGITLTPVAYSVVWSMQVGVSVATAGKAEDLEDRLLQADVNGANPHTIVGDPGISDLIARPVVAAGQDSFVIGAAGGEPQGAVVWVEQRTTGAVIMRLELASGATPQLIIQRDGVVIGNIAWDLLGNKIYWTETNANRIMRADPNGANIEVFEGDVPGALGIAVGPPELLLR